MNVTGENPQLFKCGGKGYINQTYTPKEVYDCGVVEGKQVARKKNPTQVNKCSRAARWAISMQAMGNRTFMLVVS